MRSRAALFLILLSPFKVAARQEYHKYPGYTVDQLLIEAKKFDSDAIYQLGARKDPRAIPVLISVVKQARPDPTSSAPRLAQLRSQPGFPRRAAVIRAKRALARLGVPRYMDEILIALSTPSYSRRADALQALAEIAEPATVKYIIPLLDDHYFPPQTNNHSDMGAAMPISYWASSALDDILPEIGATLKDSPHFPPKPERWKGWWSKQNPADYSLPRREKSGAQDSL